ncbi:MAG TPA: uroporphyrinogen-III synthase [Flavobacteriia bacterium]|jgi:uroporphyrinogen-III synthase|nr:uroporphyrinogen-III synthase [Flavobacteriia bacterium]
MPKINTQINILSTKKIDNNLLVSNLHWISEDFIQTAPVTFEFPKISNTDFIAFTSKNAVQSVLNQYKKSTFKNNKVVCVGNKTAALLQEKNIQVVHVANYAKELGEWLVKNNIKNTIHFCGNLKREELKDSLLHNHLNYREIQVYKTTLTPKKITDNINGIIFFSPSAVKSYTMLNQTDNKIAFCIGNTTANEAKKYFSKIIIADENSIENTIITTQKYFLNV